MLHHYIKGKEFLNFCININIFLTSTTTHWYCQLQCLYPVWLYANIFGSDLHRRFWIPKKKTSIHIQYKFSDVTENALCWIYSKSEKHEYMCRIINIIGNTMKTWNLKLKHCRFLLLLLNYQSSSSTCCKYKWFGFSVLTRRVSHKSIHSWIDTQRFNVDVE